MTHHHAGATDSAPLAGLRVVSIATNVPGPVAAARLRDLGASVTKVEPPAGDFLAVAARGWYDSLCRDQRVLTMDLKDPTTRPGFDALLAESDVLIVSSRPSALARLGLSRAALAQRHAHLCVVSIVGHASPDDERAGHDLTYQSEAGLVSDAMPVSLFADLAAAESAVSTCLALVLQRARTGGGGWTTVSLDDAARRLTLPRQFGLTTPDGVLGGALATYALYAARDGILALAALEPHFATRLGDRLQLDPASRAALASRLATGTVAEWVAWGLLHDVPIAAVVAAGRPPTVVSGRA